MASKHKVVFLDRDGTLVHDRPGYYLRRVKDLKLYRSTVQALKQLQENGFKLVVLSNQSGLARGFLTEKTLKDIHGHLRKILKDRGIHLTAIYYCPHAPEAHCRCRKPKTFLARQAMRKWGLTLEGSFIVGDKKADVDLGRNLGIPSVFLRTGHGKDQMKKFGSQLHPSHRTKNILQAAKWIIKNSNGKKIQW